MRNKSGYIEKPTDGSVAAVENARRIAEAEGRPMRILFVCLGNICRSPAADGVMHELVAQLPARLRPEIDSAGFYGGHAGELPDLRMREAARGRGLNLTHRSRQIRPSDFEYFDIIIGMDDRNMRDLGNASPTLETDAKLVRLSDFARHFPEADCVPDPYYGGRRGFEDVLDLVQDACSELFELITKNHNE